MPRPNTPLGRPALWPVSLALLVATGGLIAAAASAGPLTPPTGAPIPTMKTLAEVEPRIAVGPTTTPGDATAVYAITQPGSYYLTGNLVGPGGKSVISIRTTGVTLDLNGFEIRGGGGASGTSHGIDAQLPSATGGIIVRNGHVRECGGSGVRISAERVLVEGIIACNNGEYGIVAGSGSRIVGCTASANRHGIFTNDGSTVERCQALDNAERGFHLIRAAAVGCTARNNGAAGFYGDGDCTATDCTARENDAQGFHFPGALVARGCTASQNGQSGFVVYYGTLQGCVAHGNTGHGIRVDYASLVEACRVAANLQSGIVAFRSSRVVGCTARTNSSHGIALFTGCTATDNLCEENGIFGSSGGAGIFAEGSANRIEGNNVIANATGIQVEAPNGGNFIARNTASYNPVRHDIAPGNNNAEWIVTPGEGFTATNPWANFGI